MPYRSSPCVAGEIYHVFNRSVAQQEIFLSGHECKRFLDLLDYYRFDNPSIRYSEYNRLLPLAKQQYLQTFHTHPKLISIYCYCIMPTHFHLLVRQEKDHGIPRVFSQLQNGYAKYFNVRTKRFGAVFQSMFKAIRIETDEQFVHVARYIHLNPFTAGLIKNIQDLHQYPWTSLTSYIKNLPEGLVDKTKLLEYYPSVEELWEHMCDQADYQRLLFVESHLYHDATDPHTGGVCDQV